MTVMKLLFSTVCSLSSAYVTINIEMGNRLICVFAAKGFVLNLNIHTVVEDISKTCFSFQIKPITKSNYSIDKEII